MLDSAFLALIAGFFALTWGFVRACAALAPGAGEIRK
jgi:hypothetical protein